MPHQSRYDIPRIGKGATYDGMDANTSKAVESGGFMETTSLSVHVKSALMATLIVSHQFHHIIEDASGSTLPKTIAQCSVAHPPLKK